MTVLALVLARGGSKSIPGKNLAPVAGRPLLEWTIRAAKTARGVGRIVVSTDSDEIAAAAVACGAEAPFRRPAALSTDEATSADAAVHALEWLAAHEGYAPEWTLLLQPTSPLRTAEDIEACIDRGLSRGADAVVSVAPVATHPMWTFRLAPDGALSPWTAGDRPTRRQDLPPAFTPNGALYLIRSAVLRARRSFLVPGALGFVMTAERSLDIDTPVDLIIADHLLRTHEPPARG